MVLKKWILLSICCFVYLHSQNLNNLDEVLITATKTENSVKELTTSVQLIEADEIENSGASNLSEVLNNIPNIYMSPSGTTYRIRGMEHSDTLILIDGRRVTGEFSKTFELQRISANMIERIEILKGTSSLLYGSDAMGGVVNIITKKAKEDLTGSLQVVAAEDKKAADFYIAKKIGKTSFNFSSSYLDKESFSKNKTADIKIMQSGTAKSPSSLPSSGSFGLLSSALSDSYTVDNDYLYNLDIKNFAVNISHDFSDMLKMYFDFSYMREKKDGNYISTSYPTAYSGGSGSIMAKNVPAHQYNENERISFATGLDYNISENMQIKYDISYSKYEKDRKSYTSLYNELGYSSLKDSAFSVNKSTIKHLNNSLQFTHKLNEGNRYILGSEYRVNDTKSTAFNVDNRTYTSIFAQHEYNILKNLKIIYGARYDETSTNEDEISFSFGAVYNITDNLSLKANYAQGFRSPDDRELYVDQTTPTGKKKLGSTVIDTTNGKSSQYELKSETSETFEIGLLADYEIADFEVSIYKTNVDNRISEVSYSSYTTYENISDSQIKGIETSINISPLEDFFMKLSFSYTDAKNKTDDVPLIEIPKRLAGLTLSYFITNDIELKSITKFVGKQYSDEYEKLGGYSITNLKINVMDVIKDIDFFAGVDNVFAKETNEYLGYIPESYVYAGIKYKF